MGNWKTPETLKYAKSDEWLLLEGETATLGVSDYAQDQLNDIVFVELPSVGDQISAGDAFGNVESVKAASDLISPVSGTVTEVNSALEGTPELLNSDPYGKGWIVKIAVSDASGAAGLMDAAAYSAFCETR
ncbi:MAG: glycine cleavage system protein GcvH [Pleurocapsa minor GSE-CHR-MK-17-07R]|jgi:glycine cleavage system H protein|nr:glycine cleavage system protein GcvH [Pleurocapsa minor GSE-CHR-MK 17-07R]